MKLSDFDYHLPEQYIAQVPANPRDASRLMVLRRSEDAIEHRIFRDITAYLRAGDVLVLNNTRVIPARIPARRADTSGKLEVLLLRRLDALRWLVLIGGKRADVGMEISFQRSDISAHVTEVRTGSQRVVAFNRPVEDVLQDLGEVPLPPYIHQPLSSAERYQTVYSDMSKDGSAAAPTAGLHFTPELLQTVQQLGVKLAFCTLHIGLDTFQPVRAEDITDHKIHSEWAELPQVSADIINNARNSGGRVIAVGTTSARTLESAAILSLGGTTDAPDRISPTAELGVVKPFADDTQLYIYPGYRWHLVDGMITNFHLPKSSLLMMIGAFLGHQKLMEVYEIAKAKGYRFYSLGDAMMIL